MAKRINSTIIYENFPTITHWAACVGKKEGEGPLADGFDIIFKDTTLGEDSWEKSESKLILNTAEEVLKKGKMVWSDIDCLFSGDLLSQCIGSSFAFKDLGVPVVGLYGACSTMALSLINASNFLEGGCGKTVLATTCSHFCSSERQFRFPLEYGSQRPPSSQWTVTGSGAAVVQKNMQGVKVIASHIGSIKDMGITDANNMGAAMVPAAAKTISEFLNDLNIMPQDLDAIVTGDLGFVGSDILSEYMQKEYNIDISSVHQDCGKLIYKREEQDVHAGGSGCGCSASVLCSHFLNELNSGNLKKIMFVATGALFSPTTVKQSNSIPGIAHALVLGKD